MCHATGTPNLRCIQQIFLTRIMTSESVMMASSLTASFLFRDLFQKSFPAESYDVDVAEEVFDALARMRGAV